MTESTGYGNSLYGTKNTITCNGKTYDLTTPLVMGIINITPDSFYEGSRYSNESEILKRTEAIISEGGSIVDIGACSTRPGSILISENEELSRLLPALVSIRKYFPETLLSIDTFRSNVADKVISETGSCIINDISAGDFDSDMFEAVARLQVPYVIMHMKGNPRNMQVNPEYKDVVTEIISYFVTKIHVLRTYGIHDIIIDPGFGFGKTIEHNYHLLSKLDSFRIFGLPVLAGISRKSMVFKLLGKEPTEALSGTIALNTIALLKGAKIIRVHDVKEAVDTVKVVQKYFICHIA
jgi:dihydropteroate synthase